MNWSELSALAAVMGVSIVAVGIAGGFIVRLHVDKAKLEARVEALERADRDKTSLIEKLFDRLDGVREILSEIQGSMKHLLGGK